MLGLKKNKKKTSQSLIFDSLNLFMNSKHIDVSSYNGYFLKRVKTWIALIFSQGCPLSRPLLYWYRFLPFTLHELGTRKVIVCLVVVFIKTKWNSTVQIERVDDEKIYGWWIKHDTIAASRQDLPPAHVLLKIIIVPSHH